MSRSTALTVSRTLPQGRRSAGPVAQLAQQQCQSGKDAQGPEQPASSVPKPQSPQDKTRERGLGLLRDRARCVCVRDAPCWYRAGQGLTAQTLSAGSRGSEEAGDTSFRDLGPLPTPRMLGAEAPTDAAAVVA